jgi:hypothetical protein
MKSQKFSAMAESMTKKSFALSAALARCPVLRKGGQGG